VLLLCCFCCACPGADRFGFAVSALSKSTATFSKVAKLFIYSQFFFHRLTWMLQKFQVSAFICWLTGRNYMHRTSCLFFFMRSHALTIAKKAVSRARQSVGACSASSLSEASATTNCSVQLNRFDQSQRAFEPLRPITARSGTASVKRRPSRVGW